MTDKPTSQDCGPLRTYEVVWRTGHIETVQAHQVTFHGGNALFRDDRAPRFLIFGDFPDGWRLVLTGLESDLLTIRDVTVPEQLGDPTFSQPIGFELMSASFDVIGKAVDQWLTGKLSAEDALDTIYEQVGDAPERQVEQGGSES